MIVFCPNCGTQNPGIPGARATCSACASVFEVPAPEGTRAPPPPAPTAEKAAPAQTFSAPGSQVFAPNARTVARTNTLAVISLVAGIVCCIPLLSPGLAIGCAMGALKQIDAAPHAEGGRPLAIAGLILGVLTALMQVGGLLSLLTRRW